MSQLIPSVTCKESDQWINEYWIDEMDSILVTPFGHLKKWTDRIDRMDQIIIQDFKEIIIDNCAYGIHQGYIRATEVERLLSQLKLASMAKAQKITVVVPDVVQNSQATLRSYRMLEPILRGLKLDQITLMYVLQGSPSEMSEMWSYLEGLNIPFDIAVATQERSLEDLRNVRGLLGKINQSKRVHLFGETRENALKILAGVFDSYDTSKYFHDANRTNPTTRAELFKLVAKKIAGVMGSPYHKMEMVL